MAMQENIPLVHSGRRVRERHARWISPTFASVLVLAGVCAVFVAELGVEREPNWVVLTSGKRVDVATVKGGEDVEKDDTVHDKSSSPFSGITSFVKGIAQAFNNQTEYKPMENAPKVKVDLYMESLCPGCQYFTSHVLYPIMKEPGMSEIIDLNIIPAGNAEVVKDPKTKLEEISCQHGETECEGNKIVACLSKQHAHDKTFLSALNCIESHSPSELGSPFSGMANSTQGLFVIRSNAGLCIKKNGLDTDQVLACAEGAEGQSLLEESVAETAALKPKFEYAPWVVVDGVALKDDAYSLKERVCQNFLGVKPEECEPSRLKDYFPSQVLNAAEGALSSMSAKAARTQLNQYFDSLSAQQHKQHRLAEERAAGGREAVAASKRQQTMQALSTAPSHLLPFQYCDKAGNKVMV